MQTMTVMLEVENHHQLVYSTYYTSPHKCNYQCSSMHTPATPKKLPHYSPPPFGTGSSTTVFPASPPASPDAEVSLSNSSSGGNFFNEIKAVRERLTTSFPSSKMSSPLSS